MGRALSYMAIATVALAASAVLQSAFAQEGTATPGQPTQARVWIQNRDRGEAVPISLETVASDLAPLRVQLTGAPTVAIGAKTVVETRAAPQQWEYRNVNIPAGTDAAEALNAAGMDAWETTGVAFPSTQGTVVVMKRPR